MKHLINDTFKKLEEGLYKQPTILFANDKPKVLWNTVTKPAKEFKVKEVNSKEDITEDVYDVVYLVDEEVTVSPGPSLTIVDKVDFTANEEFVGTIFYSRDNTLDLNTVCFPFDLYITDFPENSVEFFTVGTFGNSIVDCVPTFKLPAGTPGLIKSKLPQWELVLNNRKIEKDQSPVPYTTPDGYVVMGSFTNYNVGTGHYKLNSAGTKWVSTAASSTVFPFRFYVVGKSDN